MSNEHSWPTRVAANERPTPMLLRSPLRDKVTAAARTPEPDLLPGLLEQATLAPAQGSVYSATKGAVDTITLSLSKELGARKIRVNSVSPGMVVTEGAISKGFIGSPFEAKAVEETPLGRTGQPDDIASAVVFFATEDARWITGQIVKVSGGAR